MIARYIELRISKIHTACGEYGGKLVCQASLPKVAQPVI